MAVNVLPNTSAFTAGIPRVLYTGRYSRTGSGVPSYDVSKDGRFLRVQPTGPEESTTHLNVVVNWIEEVRRQWK